MKEFSKTGRSKKRHPEGRERKKILERRQKAGHSVGIVAGGWGKQWRRLV